MCLSWHDANAVHWPGDGGDTIPRRQVGFVLPTCVPIAKDIASRDPLVEHPDFIE